jgi:hypothetical protein
MSNGTFHGEISLRHQPVLLVAEIKATVAEQRVYVCRLHFVAFWTKYYFWDSRRSDTVGVMVIRIYD